MSQHDRILRWLTERGGRGIHSFEFYGPDPWGGAPMPRGAAVIHTLKGEGLEIDATPETLHGGAKGVRYVLKSAGGESSASLRDAEDERDHTHPSGSGPPPPAVHDEAVALFGDEPAAGKRGPYDVMEAA